MKTLFFTSIFAFLVSCSAPKSFFDLATDQTIFKVYPLGSVGLPGIWAKGTYFRRSAQQHFFKLDTVVSVTVSVPDDYPWFYYADGTEFGFIKAYYEDESMHQMRKRPYERRILYVDSTQNMIIWKLDDPINDYAVCFKRKGLTIYSVIVYGNWGDEAQVAFFRRITYY